MTKELTTFAVDPARLEYGTWCHRRDGMIGEGDIAASYSGDCIAEDRPIRRPFQWQGSLWVVTGGASHHGIHSYEAYRVVHPNAFNGEATTYREKLRDADAARADPLGFYHAMVVKSAGQSMVLSGPPRLFVRGQTQQLDLFG